MSAALSVACSPPRVAMGSMRSNAHGLANAVAAWVSSDRYAMVQGYERRHAEYAFCVDVEGVPLEGYIDLICFDGEGGALVIDYKTGTSGQGEDLHERYALQAQCYAYALLSSGACEHVDMAFVRPRPTWRKSRLASMRLMPPPWRSVF